MKTTKILLISLVCGVVLTSLTLAYDRDSADLQDSSCADCFSRQTSTRGLPLGFVQKSTQSGGIAGVIKESSKVSVPNAVIDVALFGSLSYIVLRYMPKRTSTNHTASKI